MNTDINFNTQNQYAPENMVRSVTAQAQEKRQVSEVQAAVFMAKQFPRDENASLARILQSCSRIKLAEAAMYEYPRGATKVTGPSIRLAEAVATSWGNIDYGFTELSQENGVSHCVAYAWDLETNVRRSISFVVSLRRDTKGGGYALTDARDIYEHVANHAMRRVRNCILGVIPGDVVETAVEKCKHTLKSGYKEPFVDRLRKMIAAFEADYQVSLPMLEAYIGCSSKAFSENDFVRLKSVYRSLKDGMAKREDIFDVNAGLKKPEPELDKLNESISEMSVEVDEEGELREVDNG